MHLSHLSAEKHGKRRFAWTVVLLLLVVHSTLLVYSDYVHSPTLNEPGHLAAGIRDWKYGRFDLYRVNPPLVRMVAALPVIVAGIKTNRIDFYEGPGERSEFSVGQELIDANGERSFRMFMLARWACIPFSWIGGIVCFFWARDLYGPRAGILATALWCFSPNILAHASLITADVPATTLGLAACYTFWRWLRSPTWWTALLAGCVLGMAELSKFTLLIFYPLWLLLWILYRLPERATMRAGEWAREGAVLIAIMAISVNIINLGYWFEGFGEPLGKYQFVSSTFTGEKSGTIGNRFANGWFADIPVPLPKDYLLGIDLQRHDFERYPRLSYLCGEWRNTGWWYYYIYALAIKVPLGTWVLLLLLIGERIFRRWRANYVPFSISLPTATAHPARRDELALLLPATAILFFVSSQTGFSEHLRYILPILPFLFVWIGSLAELARKMLDRCSQLGQRGDIQGVASDRIAKRASAKAGNCNSTENSLDKTELADILNSPPFSGSMTDCLVAVRSGAKRFGYCFIPVIIFAAVAWSISSSLWVYPHSLSYFNEIIGGPENGQKYLLGSNLDWGQDLLYAADYVRRTTPPKTVFVAVNDLNMAVCAIKGAKPLPPVDRLQGEGMPAFTGGQIVIGINQYMEYLRDAKTSPFGYVAEFPIRHRIAYSMYILQVPNAAK